MSGPGGGVRLVGRREAVRGRALGCADVGAQHAQREGRPRRSWRGWGGGSVRAVRGNGGSRPRPMAGRTSAASPQLGGVGARSACGAAGAAVVGRRARGDARGAAERRPTCARPSRRKDRGRRSAMDRADGRRASPRPACAFILPARNERATSAAGRATHGARGTARGVLGGCGGRRPARAEGRARSAQAGPSRGAPHGSKIARRF